MNCSVYIFGDFGVGYTQYPEGYVQDIIYKFVEQSSAISQIVIHRDKNLMYYGYVRKLDVPERYIGFCVLLNGVRLSHLANLFSVYEDAVADLVTHGEILCFNEHDQLSSFEGKLIDLQHEVERISAFVRDRVEAVGKDAVVLPPTKYGRVKDLCRNIPYLEKDEDKLAEASIEYGYTCIWKKGNGDAPLLIELRNALQNKKKSESSIKNMQGLMSNNKWEYCPKCGTQHSNDAVFCHKCGFKFIDDHIESEAIPMAETVAQMNTTRINGTTKESIDKQAYNYTDSNRKSKKNSFLLPLFFLLGGLFIYFILRPSPSMPSDKTEVHSQISSSDKESSDRMSEDRSYETENKPSRNKDLTFMIGDVSFCLKYVEGGTFTMGATDEQREYAEKEEFPAHAVTLHDYYIGETEVTQELWEEIMGYNPANTIGATLPIENVSWNDCIDFIRELNNRTGKTFRLPTEAEWEYAARGGCSSLQYLYSGSDVAEDVGWIKSNCNGSIHPVGTKRPNELGIYDMTGNVCEWCQDWMSDYNGTALTNPIGPRDGTARVGRGGGWCNSSKKNRVSTRFAGKTTYRDYNLGFRIAM